jgi:hypothetical protein
MKTTKEKMAILLKNLFPGEAWDTYVRSANCVLHEMSDGLCCADEIEEAIVNRTTERVADVLTPDEITLIAEVVLKTAADRLRG